MSASVHTQGRSIGFLGKIPTQPDFVRQNIGERIGAEFDPWLVKSAQNLLLSKSEWPEGAVRFVFSAPQSDAVVVGALGKSQDQVGRTFPLAIYTSLAIGHAVRAFHAVPSLHGAFLEQAAAILADAAALTLEALRERVAGLTVAERRHGRARRATLFGSARRVAVARAVRARVSADAARRACVRSVHLRDGSRSRANPSSTGAPDRARVSARQ